MIIVVENIEQREFYQNVIKENYFGFHPIERLEGIPKLEKAKFKTHAGPTNTSNWGLSLT